MKINILMAAVSGGKETRFHNGTGHISELAVSTSKYNVCSMSHNKISLKIAYNRANAEVNNIRCDKYVKVGKVSFTSCDMFICHLKGS